jgi:hypothetical protein
MTGKQPTKQAHALAIDWASAEISGGELTVELTGAVPKGWGKDFTAVLALLQGSHQRWGTVKLTKSTIKIADVQESAEEELRHLLESAVLQVNSDLNLAEEKNDPGDGADASSTDGHKAADREMAAKFRAFAEEA